MQASPQEPFAPRGPSVACHVRMITCSGNRQRIYARLASVRGVVAARRVTREAPVRHRVPFSSHVMDFSPAETQVWPSVVRTALTIAVLILSLTLVGTAALWEFNVLAGRTAPNGGGGGLGDAMVATAWPRWCCFAVPRPYCWPSWLTSANIAATYARCAAPPGLTPNRRRQFRGAHRALWRAAEFADLAADVNDLAAGLDLLYADLEHKTLARTGELVRSERLTSVGFLAAGVAQQYGDVAQGTGRNMNPIAEPRRRPGSLRWSAVRIVPVHRCEPGSCVRGRRRASRGRRPSR